MTRRQIVLGASLVACGIGIIAGYLIGSAHAHGDHHRDTAAYAAVLVSIISCCLVISTARRKP